ncbi:uncharacterized protein LOC124541217 [Vanessa cardui]|uniref:uncharacterized protein LOC124541217 n=1 Tax=Vanessa cardui TaxID=171605 RepID=UPI001F13DEC8|nr:uncharacterized protein LOC124541217 [Vanessa cardui]
MLLYINFLLCSAWCCRVALSIPITGKPTMELTSDINVQTGWEPSSVKHGVSNEENKTDSLEQVITKVTESDAINMRSKLSANISRTRVKRQSGAGRFAEASKMPQIKLLRLFLQMFKNSWDSAYVGGAHPLHHNIPKIFVMLYKQKVVEFFIPDVGEDAQKHSE